MVILFYKPELKLELRGFIIIFLPLSMRSRQSKMAWKSRVKVVLLRRGGESNGESTEGGGYLWWCAKKNPNGLTFSTV